MRPIIPLFFLLICLSQLSIAQPKQQNNQQTAVSIEANQQRLQKLQVEIKSLEKELNSSKRQKQDLQNQLRLLDTTIGKSSLYIKELGAQIQSYKQELPVLKQQKDSLNKTLRIQQHDLAQQIRNSYMIGRQNYLKMLLNQQQPATLTRTLVYYDYINEAKTKQIKEISSKLTQINTINQNIERKTSALETNLELQIKQKKTIESNYKNRQRLISRLDMQITDKTRKQKRIEQNINNLIHILDKLEKEKQKKPQNPANPTQFAKLKGKLNWPVKGDLIKRYGTTRHIGSLKWQGIVIAAPKGEEIRAVSDGLVVFADWLRGFGLLLIIDHGEGYMSLYGQNDSLLLAEGNPVSQNDIIANAGNSGGFRQNGLYFEIRHKGKPTNPLNWLSRRK